MNILLIFQILLFFQGDITSTEDGVPYTPYEGPNWLLIVAAVATVGVVAWVVVKVFKGIQRSRNLERIDEDASRDTSKKQ